jgi:hypothetical protein
MQSTAPNKRIGKLFVFVRPVIFEEVITHEVENDGKKIDTLPGGQ